MIYATDHVVRMEVNVLFNTDTDGCVTHTTCQKHEFLKPPKANKPLFLQWEGVLTFRSSLLKAMGRGFMFHGFIVKATGRGFEKKLWALI